MVPTKTAAFHLFLFQSLWYMNAGLLAWPPPPMPAPEPREAKRCTLLASADVLGNRCEPSTWEKGEGKGGVGQEGEEGRESGGGMDAVSWSGVRGLGRGGGGRRGTARGGEWEGWGGCPQDHGKVTREPRTRKSRNVRQANCQILPACARRHPRPLSMPPTCQEAKRRLT